MVEERLTRYRTKAWRTVISRVVNNPDRSIAASQALRDCPRTTGFAVQKITWHWFSVMLLTAEKHTADLKATVEKCPSG